MRLSDRTGEADWVIAELRSWATIAGIVPPRYEAYARIFHPAFAQDLEWTGDQVRGTSEGVARWAQVADRLGAVLHPTAQWESITRQYVQPGWGENGWQLSPPAFGQMDASELPVVAEVLRRHTATPAECFATLWEGHGDLYGSDPLAETIADASERHRVALPGRDSILFELDVTELTSPSWAVDTGWGDGLPSPHTPQTLWPADRAWYLASEIDFDSTVIGGSAKLVADLLALGESGDRGTNGEPGNLAVIEVLELPAGARLTIDGDDLN